jgi:hypothetical protein
MENRLSDESLVKQLLTSSKCEICGQLYEEVNISILGHDGEMWVLQVSCGGCHTLSLLAAMIDEEGDCEFKDESETKAEEFTDLMENEVDIFKDIIITADDVLDMFIFLGRFDGNISRLFGKS